MMETQAGIVLSGLKIELIGNKEAEIHIWNQN